MASTLTNRERAHLKALAHALEPVVQIGSAGVTDAVVAEADRALTAHALMKVRIGTDDREARVALGDELCARTNATAVHRVGKVLVVWRPSEDEPAVPAKKPGSVAAKKPSSTEPRPARGRGSPAAPAALPARGTRPPGRPRRRPS